MPKTAIVIFLGFFTLTACKKERNRIAEIVLLDITNDTLLVEGNYELSGNDTYVEVGVCWSKSQDPLREDNFL